MNAVVALDIGTTTMKVSRRGEDGRVVTERVGVTPSSPIEIARAVCEIIDGESAICWAVSSLRRALVVDDWTLVLARESPARPVVFPPSADGTDVSNPLAPIHRWAALPEPGRREFRTLDAWLAERLTGIAAIGESQAWLSGLWDVDNAQWSQSVCGTVGVDMAGLPAVLSAPRIVDGICLPILGDHEATAVAARHFGYWPLRLAECGTALACMFGGDLDLSGALGIAPPQRCGYDELVDPAFSLRLERGTALAPGWMKAEGEVGVEAVIHAAIAHYPQFADSIVLCGGHATESLALALRQDGVRAFVDDRLTSSAGALLVAEAAVGGL